MLGCKWCLPITIETYFLITRLYSVKIWFSKNAFFILCFTGRAFIMVKINIKLVLEFQFDFKKPLNQPEMWIFEKWKIIAFVQNYGIFWPKGDLKPCIIMYLGNIHNMSLVIVTFGNFFFQILQKMALFGLNWEESKWPGHFCSIVLYFFASKIGVKYLVIKCYP